jgi:hypothetical protein
MARDSAAIRCYHLPMDRCAVGEVRSLEDARGYACSQLATARCEDCRRAACSSHMRGMPRLWIQNLLLTVKRRPSVGSIPRSASRQQHLTRFIKPAVRA